MLTDGAPASSPAPVQALGPAPKVKSVIYIDGFNFYYGMVRNTNFKWLNLQSLFERIRQDDDIQFVKYFTAPASNDAGQRQAIYWRALETLPKVRIIKGRFKQSETYCRVKGCGYTGHKRMVYEVEKRTDVNIAVHMLDDAYSGLAERLVVVSGDSDLVPGIEMVKQRFPAKKVTVYVPARDKTRGAATEIRQAADKNSTLEFNLLKLCQFPPKMFDQTGREIHKPRGW